MGDREMGVLGNGSWGDGSAGSWVTGSTGRWVLGAECGEVCAGSTGILWTGVLGDGHRMLDAGIWRAGTWVLGAGAL